MQAAHAKGFSHLLSMSCDTSNVRDDEEVVLQDCVGTDRDIERQLAGTDPHLRLEPLALVRDEIDHRDRCSEGVRGEAHDIVELGFEGRIEDGVAFKGC